MRLRENTRRWSLGSEHTRWGFKQARGDEWGQESLESCSRECDGAHLPTPAYKLCVWAASVGASAFPSVRRGAPGTGRLVRFVTGRRAPSPLSCGPVSPRVSWRGEHTPQRADWDLGSGDSRGGGSDRYSQQTTARDPEPGDEQCAPASVSEELRTEPRRPAPLGKCTPGRPSGVGCAVLGSPWPPSQPCGSWCASRSREQGLEGGPPRAPRSGSHSWLRDRSAHPVYWRTRRGHGCALTPAGSAAGEPGQDR